MVGICYLTGVTCGKRSINVTLNATALHRLELMYQFPDVHFDLFAVAMNRVVTAATVKCCPSKDDHHVNHLFILPVTTDNVGGGMRAGWM